MYRKMNIVFHSKHALVTGAGKGIGRAIALRLAALGAKVHAISRTQADLDSLKEDVPDIDVYNVDIADWDKTRSLVESIGPLEILVNNAGLTYATPFLDTTKEVLDNEFDINYKAAFNIAQVVARGMVGRGQGGSIVNVSSAASLKVARNLSVYSSSKAAMDMLTKTMAEELGPYNIRVNSVNPGIILTPLSLRTRFTSKVAIEYVKGRTPLRRLAEVEELVNVTMFLLSDQASFVNGLVMPVEGGIVNRV